MYLINEASIKGSHIMKVGVRMLEKKSLKHRLGVVIITHTA